MNIWSRMALLNHSDETLVTLDKFRIIVPIDSRKPVLDLLHIPHQGQTKTYLAATSRYYWPGMKEEILKAIENCPVCRELGNSQKVGQPTEEDILQRNLEPFERLSLTSS